MQGPMNLIEVFTGLFSRKIHDMPWEKFRIVGELAWNDPEVLREHGERATVYCLKGWYKTELKGSCVFI